VTRYLHKLNPDADFVALDLETTGGSTREDVVVEIGAIRYRCGYEVDRFDTLVKPSMPMLPWITRLTGITDDILSDAPAPGGVARRLIRFLRRTPLVAHNASFDVPLLERFLTRHGRRSALANPWQAPPVLCTLRLARRLLPALPTRRLEALAGHLGYEPRSIERSGRSGARFHRAAQDAEAAAHIFFRLSERLEGRLER